jgi:hypothetical protein
MSAYIHEILYIEWRDSVYYADKPDSASMIQQKRQEEME